MTGKQRVDVRVRLRQAWLARLAEDLNAVVDRGYEEAETNPYRSGFNSLRWWAGRGHSGPRSIVDSGVVL